MIPWAFLMLPFAGFLIGFFHQRANLVSLSLSTLPGEEKWGSFE